MEKECLSTHRLLTDYSQKGKIKSVALWWIILIASFIATKIPIVQYYLVLFANEMGMDWLYQVINFILMGLWVFFAPLLIWTVITFMHKQDFDEINIYNTGIGFLNTQTGEEKYSDYGDIELSYGRGKHSFWIESKTIPIKLSQYSWTEFKRDRELRNNLSQYAKFS